MSEKGDLISREALKICKHSNGYGYCSLCDQYCVEGPCKSEALIEYVPVVHGSPVYHNRPARYEHYEIDMQNRLVVCKDCGAIIDPLDALVEIAKHYERIERWNQAVLDQRREIENYKPRLLVIRELEKRYCGQKMAPRCPHCGKPFDLKEIAKGSWCSRRFLEEK